MISAERLRELLDYDPVTGLFTRRVDRSNQKAGSVVGCPDSKGHLQVRIDGKLYLLHRLAWLYMTGEWPSDEIDHEDTDKANNRWLNLRPADDAITAQNRRRANKNNLLGVMGVSRNRNGFSSEIRAAEARKYLGTFKTPEQAHAAYVAAKRSMHPGCTI